MISIEKVLENTKAILKREGYKASYSEQKPNVLVVSNDDGYHDMFTLEDFNENGVMFKSAFNGNLCDEFFYVVEKYLGEILYTYGEVERKMEDIEEEFKTKISKGIVEFLSSSENSIVCDQSYDGEESLGDNNTSYLLREANTIINQVRRELHMVVRLAGDTLTNDVEEYIMVNVEKLAKLNVRIEEVL